MLQTVSSVLTHFRRIEEALIQAYGTPAKDGDAEFYGTMAKEHVREIESVERAYRDSVSDAYSVAFLPEPLYETRYCIEASAALLLEELLQKYAGDASKAVREQLPEVAQALRLTANKSGKRIEALRNM